MISDEPLLVDTGKGFSVKWRNRFLYSSRDPKGSVLRRAKAQNLEEDTLYLIPSPLLGYGMDYLLEQLPSGSFILGVERFQELMASTQIYLPEELLKGENCSIIRTENITAAAEFVSSLGWERFKRCRRIELTGGSRLDSGYYQSLEEELNRRIFTYWQTRASLVRMGPLWFRNIFRNIPALSQGKTLSSLKVKGSLMLCGAGESLELSLPMIKENRENLFLCTVDTAYPVLLSRGIVPDAVFNLDGQFYNFYDYYQHRGEKVFLISDITSFPQSLRLPGVEPLYFSSHFADNDLLSHLESASLLPHSIAPLGSVGVTALHLCTQISEGPIILSGLDFSYQPGKSHARGSIYHQLFLSWTKRLLPDGGMTELSLKRPAREALGQLTGKKLRSDVVLEGYFHSFKELLSLHKERCYQLAWDFPSHQVPLLKGEELGKLTKELGKPTIVLSDSEDLSALWKDFLTEEIAGLESVLKAWDIYNRYNDALPLTEALSSCDYLTITLGIDKNDGEELYYTGAVKNARLYHSYAKQALLSLS
ncbi:MAG: DUF115 domain-containing protein [Spirochaetales bacterium]|nr:DUF115 domain-containing protein [Spirochaetales bacterium]